jgi:hypothetical protein
MRAGYLCLLPCVVLTSSCGRRDSLDFSTTPEVSAAEQEAYTAPTTQNGTLSTVTSSSFQNPVAEQTALDLLFIHHSCGGTLLASPGPGTGTNCIYTSHANGGDLRKRLEQSGYAVHEASYGSRIGQKTDLFDWLPKFRDQMDDVLACDVQDTRLSEGHRNRIVVFKSCYPNNAFRSEGQPPGNPNGPELTVWNAKATYSALLDEFKKHPEVLFVCVTAPPLAPKTPPQPLWKTVAKALLGRRLSLAEKGRLARQFNTWLASKEGWLKDYPLKNVAVFDYYDILTGHGKSDLSVYPTDDGFDSHPSREGNEKAAAAFVPFLNEAVRRAGLKPWGGRAEG